MQQTRALSAERLKERELIRRQIQKLDEQKRNAPKNMAEAVLESKKNVQMQGREIALEELISSVNMLRKATQTEEGKSARSAHQTEVNRKCMKIN